MTNIAGTHNPTGGVFAARRFGQGLLGSTTNSNAKAMNMPKHQRQFDSDANDETFDDNLSQGDVILLRNASSSDYNTDQSFLSIRHAASSDGNSSYIIRPDSDTSSQYLDTDIQIMKRNSSSNWDASSDMSGSIIIVGGDGGSSYNGSDVVSETTIK